MNRFRSTAFLIPCSRSYVTKSRASPRVKKSIRAVPIESHATPQDKREISLLLANKFNLATIAKTNADTWWLSEKLDGVRAFWDGESRLWSRLGNAFIAPKWFTDKLPKGHTLDGELWHARDAFSTTVSIVKSHSGERWDQLRYKVFDIPSSANLPFESRLDLLRTTFPRSRVVPLPSLHSQDDAIHLSAEGEIVDLVEQVKSTGMGMLSERLKAVEAVGGEGLMLREPGSLYIFKRSSTLLKVKSFFEADAKVIGYEPGKGKYVGLAGSLLCEMHSGKTFNCGSGLSDEQRRSPPEIGSIINYRFQEMTKDAIPRFPSFVGERMDMTEPKDYSKDE